MQPFGDARDWFLHRRFGLFVHWGLYALGGWQEQELWRARVAPDTYTARMHDFNPTRFDPDAWLDVVEATGMQYVCLTAKHHDGFCLWDTALTDYKITNTPYGQDIVRQLAEACQRRGMPLMLYYSVVDWHHPNYPNQGRSHELAQPKPGDTPDLEKYLDFLRGQIHELCANYGPLHGIWWDMNVTGHTDPAINAMIRAMQPAAVINDRGFDAGDFGTPERTGPDGEVRAYAQRVEHCQSVGRQSWGYRANEDYYADIHLQRSIDAALARGGNYLLNVGPMPDGTLPEAAVAILNRLGSWFDRVRPAFDGAEPLSDLTTNPDVLLTRRGTDLYVHLYQEPVIPRVLLPPLRQQPRRAVLLNTGAVLPTSLEILPTQCMQSDGRLTPEATLTPTLQIHDLPVNALHDQVMVIQLEGVFET